MGKTQEPTMTDEQKQSKICEMQQLLAQHDYAARKVAFEVAKKLQELHPGIELPVYESYKAMEEQAEEFRRIINEMSE